MKKQKLKSLNLNKKSISNLELKSELLGGGSLLSCGVCEETRDRCLHTQYGFICSGGEAYTIDVSYCSR